MIFSSAFDLNVVFSSLEKLTESNNRLGGQLLDFIGQFQTLSSVPSVGKLPKSDEVAMPTKQIYFDGKLLKAISN